MKKSFEEVWAMQEEFKVYPRLAAYMVALRRLVEALKIKGYNG
jgi:putative glutamate dehydrogenase